MKNIIKSLLALVLALAVMPLMTSCDTDTDSNPTLQQPTTFVLNTPPYSGNVYDLANSSTVNFTTSQPDYGFPVVTTYEVQVSLDERLASVASVEVPDDIAYITLEPDEQGHQAKIGVDAVAFNNAVVNMYQRANNGADPSGKEIDIYVRLVAHVAGDTADFGWCYSNTIKMSVVVSYVATLPTEIFVAGPSIHGGADAKELGAVYDMAGEFYGMVYISAGANLTWGDASDNVTNGYSATTSVVDEANAGLSGTDNITFANAGWYALHLKTAIEDNSVRSTLTVYPGIAYVTGAVAGDVWNDPNTGWELTPPADASGEWVSPAFAGSGELRAFIKIPGLDWWRTEFTLYNGALYWRDANIVSSWAENVGSAYSVSCTTGQRLYVDFDHDRGEVRDN